MPHLILEYTNNLAEPVDLGALLARLHATLAETAACPLAQIKSRAVPLDVFRVGSGSPDGVFAHLTVGLLEGRDPPHLKRIGESLLAVVREAFARSYAERPCDLTVDVRELRRDTYCKDMNDRARTG